MDRTLTGRTRLWRATAAHAVLTHDPLPSERPTAMQRSGEVLTITAEAPVTARRLRQRDFVLLSLYWVAIGYLWQSLGTLILPDLVQALVGSAHKGVALSVLEGIGTLFAVVWQPVAGAISDRTTTRFGRRHPFIAGGTVGDVLFLAGIALAGTYWMVVVFYFLLQAASNTAQAPYQGLLPDAVPEEQRGTASGYYGLANLAGILLGTVGAGLLLAHGGRGLSIAGIIALLVVTMVATVLGVPDRTRARAGQFQSVRQAVRTTFATPLRHPDFLWLMGSRLLILMGIVGIQSFALFYFTDVFFPHDQSAAVAATTALVGVVVLVAILVTWPAARLSDRFGRRSIIVAGGLLAAAGTAALVFSAHAWLPGALIAPVASALHVPALAAQATLAGVLVGAGFGMFLSVDWAFLTDVIPRDEAGLFFGFANIATAGSGIIARFIGGYLLDAFNGRGRLLGLPGGYPVIFGIFTVWLVAGSLLVLRVRERHAPHTAAA